jgi:hypothetical protein
MLTAVLPPRVPAREAHSSSALAIVAGPIEGDPCALLRDAVDLGELRLRVVALPRLLLFVRAFAPLSGCATPASLRADALAAAEEQARTVAMGLPLGSTAAGALPDWCHIEAELRSGHHELALVLGRVGRRRLRTLVEVCAATRTALVLGR